jgi:hypothetical protein
VKAQPPYDRPPSYGPSYVWTGWGVYRWIDKDGTVSLKPILPRDEGGKAPRRPHLGRVPGMTTVAIEAPCRLFDIGGGPWEIANRADPIVAALADRHYPRRSRGCGRVGGPGSVLVLHSRDWTAGWITLYTQFPDDGLDAWQVHDVPQ